MRACLISVIGHPVAIGAAKQCSASLHSQPECLSSSVDRSATGASLADVDIRTRLGQNIRRLRLAKGWSQEAYADEAGIHRTYVSDIERGARNPTITVVEKLAVPLGVSTGALLE